MDTQRLVALFVFLFSAFMLWQQWQKQALPPPAPPASSLPQAGTPPAPSNLPAASPTVAPAPAASGAVAKGERIKISTDFMAAEIDTVGGDLRRLELTQHLASQNSATIFDRLLNLGKPAPAVTGGNLVLFDDNATPFYVAQSGLVQSGLKLPNHTTVYRAEALQYKLADGQEALRVALIAPAEGGVEVHKVYVFHRASYLIEVGYEIRNAGEANVAPEAYFHFLRDNKPPVGDPRFIATYTGPALYTEQSKFQKVAFGDIDKSKRPYPASAKDGWVAMLQHYFVAAWLPKAQMERQFYTEKVGQELYRAGVRLPVGAIAPGATASLTVPLYVGPQEGEKLAKLAPGLDLTIDFGWLTVIAYPLFWVLTQIHKLVGNWGVAIILLTAIIKLIFFPLSAASYKSMARMKVLAPKLQQLKERYGDNREKMNQAMMELYKSEKVNPLGGCLPIVIQIPVFIALYWVLLAAVELRNAPFFGWITDLSTPDRYGILPLIMGATMLLQTKLNPTPPDPVQARIMMIMPIAFSVFFFFFPAGLVLYWTVNNVLSIAQQWQINRIAEHSAAKGNAKR